MALAFTAVVAAANAALPDTDPGVWRTT